MRINKTISTITVLVFLLTNSCPAQSNDKAFGINKKLGRGMNFGNGLEAPREGMWGVTLRDEYFKVIKEAGFDSVRVPIRWSAHAKKEAPYTIDERFFKRIDEVIENSLSNDLCVVINMHHYEEIFREPDKHADRFVALWEQIARRYKKKPDSLVFELLNEPHNKLDDARWDKLVVDTLKEVRKSNPDRVIMIGPVWYNSVSELSKLELPADDRNIIVSFHYYLPFDFTHQGAGWVGPFANMWLGTKWTGSEQEKAAIEKNFDKAYEWGQTNGRPINIGEFGAYDKADMDSRAKWTSFVSRHAEEKGFSWMYWEFCSGFGAYDKDEDQWRQPLLNALVRR
jgi:endoglucanase